MEKISFFDILIQSWNLSFSRATFLFFGFFMALPIAAQFLPPFSLDQPDASALVAHVFASPGYSLLFLCLYFFSTLFGKGNLIYEFSQEQKKNTPPPAKTLSRKRLWERTQRTFLIEILFGVFIFCMTLVLVLPSILSFFLFDKIPEALIFTGLLLYIPLLIITFFIHQFSLYYFLLSPLQITSAIERSILLFKRHRLPTLFFGIFSFSIYVIFTFSLNLAMLGGVALLQKVFSGTPESVLLFCLSLGFLTWYTVFSQALWFHFFIHLAKPKQTLLPEDPVLTKEGLPETPSA